MMSGLHDGASPRAEPPVTMSDGTASWLRDHLQVIENRVLAEAESLAAAAGRETIEPSDVAAAAVRYAPGHPVPRTKRHGWLSQTLGNIPEITFVGAVLAVFFSVIWALRPNETAWADIIKLLAGTVVGSAGSGVAATHWRRGRGPGAPE